MMLKTWRKERYMQSRAHLRSAHTSSNHIIDCQLNPAPRRQSIRSAYLAVTGTSANAIGRFLVRLGQTNTIYKGSHR